MLLQYDSALGITPPHNGGFTFQRAAESLEHTFEFQSLVPVMFFGINVLCCLMSPTTLPAVTACFVFGLLIGYSPRNGWPLNTLVTLNQQQSSISITNAPTFVEILGCAIAVAVIAVSQSLQTTRAIDRQTKSFHGSLAEIRGLSFGNIVSGGKALLLIKL